MEKIIHVIGLGPGGINDLTAPLLEKIKAFGTLYLRTADFPLIDLLKEQGIGIESFDDLYETYDHFDQVYQAIVQKLISLAQQEGAILYGVPGHPRVAERTVAMLVEMARTSKVKVKIEGGHSFLDQVFTSFGFDPIEGFNLLDGTSATENQFNPRLHTVIAQVYDRLTASDLKITLMNVYPDEMTVWVGSYLGTEREKVHEVPLFAIDQEGIDWDNYSLLYIPPAEDEQVFYRQFSYVREIVAILRSPDGCPWDREQTHESIRKNLIEETYEVLEAIDLEDLEGLQEELGDLLLQILLHSQMAEEEGFFDIQDVIFSLSEKLIRRHPHVFGKNKASNANEALQNWQEMKRREKEAKGIDIAESILDGIPKDLPAVLTAYNLQKKASTVGFDWDEQEEVLAKVEEEWIELKESQDFEQQKEELGDLLFSLVNLARFLKIDPEEALAKANHKFKLRFHYIEKKLREKGKELKETSLQEMEQLWQEAKKS